MCSNNLDGTGLASTEIDTPLFYFADSIIKLDAVQQVSNASYHKLFIKFAQHDRAAYYDRPPAKPNHVAVNGSSSKRPDHNSTKAARATVQKPMSDLCLDSKRKK